MNISGETYGSGTPPGMAGSGPYEAVASAAATFTGRTRTGS